MTEPSRHRLARALFRGLLALYPCAILSRFGAAAEELFREQLEAAGGGVPASWMAARALADAARRLAYEHLRLMRRRARTRPAGGGESQVRTIFFDLHSAWRGVRRQPGTTAMIAGMLALGVAASVAVFTLVNGLFLRPLPFPEPDSLVYLDETAPRWHLETVGINYADFATWRQGVTKLEGMGLYETQRFNVAFGGETERLTGAAVTYDLAGVLGIETTLGRGFTALEDSPTGEHVVLLGNALWRDWFAASPQVLGRSLSIDAVPHTIVGVLPAQTRFPVEASLWVPLRGDASLPSQNYRSAGVARLAPGVSLEEGLADLMRANQPVWEDHDQDHDVSPVLRPFRQQYVRDFQRFAAVLTIGVAVVLVIACANVAAITLARAIARREEIGLRLALGAGLGRLSRQLGTESLMLSLAGGGIGIAAGTFAARLLVAASADQFPVWIRFDPDLRVWLFAVAVTLLTTVLFGWAPLLQARRANIRTGLSARGRSGPAGARTLQGLVLAEIALASLLLVGGGLVLRSMGRLVSADPGYRADGVLAVRLALPEATYPDPTAWRAFYDELLTRLGALPGVAEAAAITCPPLTCHWGRFLTVEGEPPRAPDAPNEVILTRLATPGYLETMGIPLLVGRDFDQGDAGDSRQVLIVNQTFAEAHWPDPSAALGHRVRFGRKEDWKEIVGVARDVKHYGVDQPMRPGVYEPLAQEATPELTVVVRAATDSVAPLVEPVRRIVHDLDPELPLFDVGELSARLAGSQALRRLNSWLLTVFAAVALVLAMGGTYGVIAYGVVQRRRELGIRSALGAGRARVGRWVLGRGLRPVVAGTVLGFLAAWLAMRSFSSLLYGVGASDPLTYAVVAALLLVAALAATLPAARRAMATDPNEALREE